MRELPHLNRLRGHVGAVLRALRAGFKSGRAADETPAPDAAPRPLPRNVLRNLPRVKPRNEFGLRRARTDNPERV